MIKRSAIPKGVELTPTDMTFNTTGGKVPTRYFVVLKDVILPEFLFSRRVKEVQAFVFEDDKTPHDIIFGCNFLNSCKIDVCSSDLTCKWFENTIPFHDLSFYHNNSVLRDVLTVPSRRVARFERESHAATTIKATKNTKISVEEVCAQQIHLTAEQQAQLLAILKKHT